MPSIYIVFTSEVILFIFILILGFCYPLCVKLSQSSSYNTEQKNYLTSIYSWKFQTVNTQDSTLDSLYLVRDIICVEKQKHRGLETGTFLSIHTHSQLGSHCNIVHRGTHLLSQRTTHVDSFYPH